MASLQDQILQRWGQYGDWQSAGQDQAADLARLLEANGISDLSKLNVTQKEFDVGPQTNVLTGFVGDNEQYGDVEAYKYKAPVFQYDGRELGFLGDINKDGSVARVGDQQHLGYDGGPDMGVANDKLAAWSSRGGGHTNFQLVPDGSGGFAIAPVWESSKADDLYNAKMAALFAAGGYGAAVGAGTGMAAAVGQGAATGAYTGVASSAVTGADPLKAGYGGLVTGALTGGVKGLGQTQGWDPSTTRAVSGGANAALRGGSGDDILKGAATGFVTGGGVGDMLKDSNVTQGVTEDLGGNMDFANSFDNSLYDFGGGDGFDISTMADTFGGTSDNYFGDTFGNSPTDFGSEFDPSIFDFGQGFDPNTFDWSKLGNQGMKWLMSGGGKDGTGFGGNLMKLLGAYAGYQGSKDQNKTTSVEPWKDAQPMLRGLLQQGQDLSAHYQANPFNQAQKTGLGNLGQLYDFANQNAGGLLQGFHQNAAGNNQFVRGQPQRLLQGAGPAVGTFNPGSYGNFLG